MRSLKFMAYSVLGSECFIVGCAKELVARPDLEITQYTVMYVIGGRAYIYSLGITLIFSSFDNPSFKFCTIFSMKPFRLPLDINLPC